MMDKRPDLESSLADIDSLWEQVHKVRKGSKTVKVNKAQLESVLMDHHKFYDAVFGTRIENKWKAKK